MAEATAQAPNNWFVQIGPDLGAGTTAGSLNTNAAMFYLSAPGDEVSAFVSSTAGGSWEEIPADEPYPVSGGNNLQWRLEVPNGATAKFVIAPA